MKLFKRRYSPPGTPPGTLISKDVSREKANIKIISYSSGEYEELEVESAEECKEYVGKREVTWINVDGTQDIEVLEDFGENFGFHSLAIEDVINTGQRPKVEDFGDYIFLIVRFFDKTEITSSVNLQEINVFIGSNFILTIQDKSEVFEPVRQRIKESRGKIRNMKADYLAYAIIDLIVDQYFPVMESIGERIESIDDELQEEPSAEIVNEIREIKRELILIRSSNWPMRDIISKLQREESKLISDTTDIYLRDVYDHTIQIADIVESYRDILSEMFNVYLSVTANSTNEVMKILTIFATIFIPLTFVVGIYGMNFEYMPELRWKPGYFVVIGVMVIISIAMLRFFKKRGWL